jgi:hypothetical protein
MRLQPWYSSVPAQPSAVLGTKKASKQTGCDVVVMEDLVFKQLWTTLGHHFGLCLWDTRVHPWCTSPISPRNEIWENAKVTRADVARHCHGETVFKLQRLITTYRWRKCLQSREAQTLT